ncbi:hypothetical protein H5410_055914 [Solanum commersonii]|uniref:Uncharacterized protein n=1 Tax=Solanum commersonii TaxID=4109 RepID=A0A9J5WKS2_SOLCO|nr:hypothetical protein H5410_055914 [Solanum commersonii]
MDEAPSTNTRHIFYYKDIGWAENRSKKLHDPLIMVKSLKYVIKQIPTHSEVWSNIQHGFCKRFEYVYGCRGYRVKWCEQGTICISFWSTWLGQHQDAFQMGIMYFIHTFVFSQMVEAIIHVNDLLMVEDGSYYHFLGDRLHSPS